MPSRKLLYDTGVKKIHEGDSEEQLIFAFSDNLPGTDGKAGGRVKGKAANNNAISSQIFEYLASYNILNHYISKLSDKEMQVKNLEMIPIEIIVYNAADKAMGKRFGFENGSILNAPVIECYYKNDNLKNPLVNESHISALGLISQEEIHLFNRIIAKTNAVLKSFFERRNLYVTELHLQIGRYKGNLYIGDEITPDTCQFWGIVGDQEYDKNSLKVEKNNISEVYKKVVAQLIGSE